MDEPTDVALLLLLMYALSALAVLAVSPDVSFARRTGAILVPLLLVLSVARSGERKEVEDLGVWTAKVYAGRPCDPLCQDR